MQRTKSHTDLKIESGEVFAYRIPTDEPESDGTLKWDHTDLILVMLQAGGRKGVGYTYANTATARMISDQLLSLVKDQNPLDINGLWLTMIRQIRNLGRPGISSMAISAVDNALWDLKAKLLNLPLCKLLGQVHGNIPAYASGGFTAWGPHELKAKWSDWLDEGFSMYKMKIGRDKAQDRDRMAAARELIGDAQLFVDANGAYYPKEALAVAEDLAEYDVRWYEEPVTSDNLDGLRQVREAVPAKIKVTAGEYGYSSTYFNRMLAAEAVDVLQADATRCAGITGFIKAHSLCEAYHLPFSAHCGPSLHLHPCLALQNAVHIEYFHDHVHIEHELFDGAPQVREGVLHPDLSRPGLGLEFKFQDAEKYQLNF